MSNIELLAIVEVPENKKVMCQADGCGHNVFRRIHVIRQNGALGVFGSDCAKRLFGERLKAVRPSIQVRNGISLTELDVELLEKNTEELISKLRKKFKQRKR